MKQAADVLRLEKETAEKLAAKAFAKSYLADLVPSVFNNLRENGYFFDPVHRDLEVGFMPWIMERTLDELQRVNLSRLLLDNLLREVVSHRELEYSTLEERLAEQKRQEELAAQQQQVTIEITEPSNQNIAMMDADVPFVGQSNDSMNEEGNQNETSNQPDDVSSFLN